MNKPLWLEIAEKEIGIREIPGPLGAARILEYHRETTLRATSDEIPWCSSFVNWCMAQAGITPTHSAAARSWLKWGKPLSTPVPGCIVVLRRGNDPAAGHVGFYVSGAAQYIKLLGGNQGDQVRYANYPAADVIGYRWPEDSDGAV